MRVKILLVLCLLLSSCNAKYKGMHTNFNKFTEDVNHCLNKSCIKKTKSFLDNISIISSLFAYGGGGGGGGGGSFENKIAYKQFNLCMSEKGYVKDENGIFELPYLDCK